MADPAEHSRRGPARRALTAGAAASLVLSVAPVVPSAAVNPTDDKPQSVQRLNTPRASNSRLRYRLAVRRAHEQLRREQSSATRKYAAALTELRRSFRERLTAASTKPERTHAREDFGVSHLPLKLTLAEDLATAQQRFVERMELARVTFLAESNAAGSVFAEAQFRRALTSVTVDYQTEVRRERADFRMQVAQSRQRLRSRLGGADNEGELALAHQACRTTVLDASGVLRLRLRNARDRYLTKRALVKSAAAATTSTVDLSIRGNRTRSLHTLST